MRLKLVYEVVDERTKAILEEIGEIKKGRKGDFRFLNQKSRHSNSTG
ncbi:MAG: hypothetical protein ABWK02_01345 [Aquificaceae bacterium]|nr:hypothetical protein [Aquificaceae bacterium]